MAYLLEQLHKKDIEQHVLCSKGSKTEVFLKESNHLYTAHPKTSGFDLLFALKLARLCKKYEFDCIHTHDSHAHTAAVLSAVLFRNKTPLVVSRRVDFPVSRSWFSRFKYNHSSVQYILCVSQKIKEITAPAIKDRMKLKVVYSGVDLNRFNNVVPVNLHEEYSVPRDYKLVGNIAALAPHKDYDTFILTAEKLLEKGEKLHFFIVGDGPLKNRIENRVKESKYTDRFTLTGFRTDPLNVLKALDIFLITSKTEGLGTSIIDAFGSSIPVVATRAGGIPELVIHEKTGLTAPVKDVDNLAKQVSLILSDESLRLYLIQNALEKTKAFSVEKTAQDTYSIYQSIVNQQ